MYIKKNKKLKEVCMSVKESLKAELNNNCDLSDLSLT